MEREKESFTSRQVMNTIDFEIFHNIDQNPIDVDYHNHDFYEIFMFLSGDVVYVIEGKHYHLIPGDILLTNNKELHKPIIQSSKPYERFVVWVNPSFIEQLEREGHNLSECFDASSKKHYNLLRPSGEMLQYIHKILEKLETAYYEQSYGNILLQSVYLMELLVYINRAYFDTSSDIEIDIEYNSKISEVLLYINSHLCEVLSLDLLAEQFYLSKYHLGRQFKKHTGFTLHQYIIKKRLITAKNLLISGTSAMEAFLGSGFGDYSNFTKAFKEEFGVSPRDYHENTNDSHHNFF